MSGRERQGKKRKRRREGNERERSSISTNRDCLILHTLNPKGGIHGGRSTGFSSSKGKFFGHGGLVRGANFAIHLVVGYAKQIIEYQNKREKV